MTGFLKGKAITQVDELLINGERYTEQQIKEILKGIEPTKKAKKWLNAT